MAGIAALMRSRKERERKRHTSIQDEGGFGEVIPGKDGAAAGASGSTKDKILPSDKSPTSLKKLGIEPQSQSQSQSQQTPSNSLKKGAGKKLEGESIAKTKEQRLIEHIVTESYTPVYLGFIFISIGLVITFVGLGDKGFRTTELRLIGPCLCFVGLSCIIYKILQCHFPRIFVVPYWLKKARLADKNATSTTNTTNLIEHGIVRSIHIGTSLVNNTSPTLSPRVILQSGPQVARPKSTTTISASTIPNYIDDSSDDDFDSGIRRPLPAPPPLPIQQEQQQPQPPSKPHRPLAHHLSYDDKKHAEIILNPKSLML